MTGASVAGAILVALGALHLAYTYAAYPWLVRRLPRREPRRTATETTPRLVSVIIAARINGPAEGDALVAKVRQLLATIGLPCEVIVAVDGEAPPLVAGLRALDDERVTVVNAPERSGKAVALNRGVAAARGDVLLFTDVRQHIHRGAAGELLEQLASPDVGAVSGALELAPGPRAEGLYERYWRFERDLRAREAAWDSAVGVSGALYALKREYWVPLPAGLILDDVWVPFQVINAGKRVAFAPGAVATDRGAASDAGELARKVRTLTGNYQLLAWMPWLLLPTRNRIWWQFVSHKVMRLLTPLAAASLVAGAALLVPPAVTLGGTALVLVLWSARPRRGGPGVGVRGTVRAATVMFVALIVAAFNALRGRWDVWSTS
jgi:cellulose synthase/poly-beta-1,6-N-acetylglucosamine synthase-like glycosyltransferase